MKTDTATQNVTLMIHLRETPTLPERTLRQCAYEAELLRRLQLVTTLLRLHGTLSQSELAEFLHLTLGIGLTTARTFLLEARRNRWLRLRTVMRKGHTTHLYSLPKGAC